LDIAFGYLWNFKEMFWTFTHYNNHHHKTLFILNSKWRRYGVCKMVFGLTRLTIEALRFLNIFSIAYWIWKGIIKKFNLTISFHITQSAPFRRAPAWCWGAADCLRVCQLNASFTANTNDC
jgi:hypothetical protein